MKLPRFYQQSDMQAGLELELSNENHRHAVQVLRLKLEQSLILFNGNGGEYIAKIIYSDRRKSRVLIKHFDPVDRESLLSITLALATIKPDKMDFAIQKSVELGVSAIQPVYTKRSVIKIKENRLDKKIQHWRGIIIAACEQSGRTAIPNLYKPMKFENFMEGCSSSICLAMLPGNHPTINKMNNIKEDQNLSLLVGPEGGFTEEEEQTMIKKGVSPFSFGSRILRAETAVIAGLTACQQNWGDL